MERQKLPFSAVTGTGCRELTYAIMEYLEQESRAADKIAAVADITLPDSPAPSP